MRLLKNKLWILVLILVFVVCGGGGGGVVVMLLDLVFVLFVGLDVGNDMVF